MSMKKGLMLLRPVAAIVMLGMGLSGAAHATGFENPSDADVTFTVNAPTDTTITFNRASSTLVSGPTAKSTLIGTVMINNATKSLQGLQWVEPAGDEDQSYMVDALDSTNKFPVAIYLADQKTKASPFNVLGTNGKSVFGDTSRYITDSQFAILTSADADIPPGLYSAKLIASAYY